MVKLVIPETMAQTLTAWAGRREPAITRLHDRSTRSGPAVLPYSLSLWSPMRLFSAVIFSSTVLLSSMSTSVGSGPEKLPGAKSIFGFRDATAESAAEMRFLAVPDPKLAEQHLRTLTQFPHMAGTPGDKATADYVAQKFRDAGLDTEMVEYKVWMNYPSEVR